MHMYFLGNAALTISIRASLPVPVRACFLTKRYRRSLARKGYFLRTLQQRQPATSQFPQPRDAKTLKFSIPNCKQVNRT